jgi:hypothetical protein
VKRASLEALNYVERKPRAATPTDQFERWYKALPQEQASAITARINLVERVGPTLGRPTVDRLHGAPDHKLKELRFRTMRVLFAFDSDRQPVMLVGGDKQGNWERWYPDAIKRATRALANHERSKGREESSHSPSSRSRGSSSSARGR